MFLVIVTTMSLIILRVLKQEKSVQSCRFKQLAMRKSLRKSDFAHPTDSSFQEEDSRRLNNRQSISPFQRSCTFSVTTGRMLSLIMSKKNREVMLQAFGYVLCYVDTSILPCTNHMILEDMKMDVPYALRLTPRLINPGQGTLNILVYTRPHINSLRRAYP